MSYIIMFRFGLLLNRLYFSTSTSNQNVFALVFPEVSCTIVGSAIINAVLGIGLGR